MLDQQLKIEADMSADAKRRMDEDNRKTVKRKAWSESKLGIRYTVQSTKRFALAVEQAMRQEARVGSNVRAWKLLAESGLEPETVAYLFSKSVYNQLPLVHRKSLKRVSFCLRAAGLIHDELRIKHFASSKERKNLLKKLFKQFDARTYPREWRKRTIRNYFHAEQIEWNLWSDRERLLIGYALLVLYRDTTGLLDAPKNSAYINPTTALIQHVEETMLNRMLDFMLYKPMVVPPVPWTTDSLFRGGYLSANVRPYSIIKGATSRDVPRFETMDWSRVLPAINAMQETPWRVNKKILDALEWCMFVRGGNMAGLPRADAKPLPPKPRGYGEDEGITKEHDKKCFLVHSENREVISKRLMVLATIAVARQYKNFPEIYYPHNLDTRGRAYPLPVFLQPQGPDATKALLEFAHGLPIETEEAACWLAIAGANAWGNDKVSLKERADWVVDNEEMIKSIARDPKTDLRWTVASEPFQFLRFAYEWADFCRIGFGFVSHMVCSADATCSGLQHYSMALRDSVGGRSVNLVPGLPRQDIYQDVADKVIDELMRLGTDDARDWLQFGINRKTTKRQVMVVPYAGTFSSCLSYTREAVLEKIKDGHPCPWSLDDSVDHSRRIALLAKLIWEAIDQTVVKGKEAMRWLSLAAKEYTKWANANIDGDAHAKRMSWITPDGFEAIHFRADMTKGRVDTFIDGRITLTYRQETARLCPADMSLAVAPNWVHSLDATLLRASIMRAVSLDNPITAFAMVHDSFGVHASRMGEFLDGCIKPAFIEMYEQDVLQQFAERLPPVLQLPAPPEKGDLDPRGVQDSEFFFS